MHSPSSRCSAFEISYLAVQHKYVLWRAMSLSVLGAALIARGEARAGVDKLREAGRILNDMGYVLWQPFYLSELGHGYGQMGDHAAALEHIDEAVAMLARTRENFWAPDVHRHRGEWLWASGDAEAGETALREALTIADELSHRMGALRIGCSLGRRWHGAGHGDEARSLLAPIFARIDAHADAPDLADARQLLASGSMG